MEPGRSLRVKKDYIGVSSTKRGGRPSMHHIFRLPPDHIENMWEYKDILFSSTAINIFDRDESS